MCNTHSLSRTAWLAPATHFSDCFPGIPILLAHPFLPSPPDSSQCQSFGEYMKYATNVSVNPLSSLKTQNH